MPAPSVKFDPTTERGMVVDRSSALIGLIQSSGSPSTAPGTRFSDDETIVGTINGTNRVFTLAHAPNPARSLIFVVDGVTFKQDSAYVLDGAQVTCAPGNAPVYTVAAWFRY